MSSVRFDADRFALNILNRVSYACKSPLCRFSSCAVTDSFARERLHALDQFREQIARRCAMVSRFF